MVSKLYTPNEVAEILKVRYNRVLELIKLGKLSAYKIGKFYRISEGELFEFLESHRYKSYWKNKN